MSSQETSESATEEDSTYISDLRSYRATLQQIQSESQTDFDKTLIAVSSGALGVTVGFFDKLPPETWKVGVLIAWGFWALSLICIIGSFSASVGSAKKSVDQLDRYLTKKRKRPFSRRNTCYDTVILWANRLSFGFLVLGIVAFTASLAGGILGKGKVDYERETKNRGRNERTANANPATITPTKAERTNGSGNGGKIDATSTAPPEEVITEDAAESPPSASETPHPPDSEPAEPPSP